MSLSQPSPAAQPFLTPSHLTCHSSLLLHSPSLPSLPPSAPQSDIVRINVTASPLITQPALWTAQESLRLEQQAADPGLAHQQQQQQQHAQQPEGDGHPILGRVKRVGEKAHGLVPWQGAYIMLDSDNGALIALDLSGVAAGRGFQVVRLWKAPEDGM